MTATDAATPAVLLVDDRRENLLALEAVLAPLAVRLVSADSGEAALKELLRDDFAAILLDVQMPGMDGFETAELIRGRERTRHVPIIFVTALSKDLRHVARGYEAGAVDYVLKPFDPFVLRSKVQVFCDLARQRRERERADDLLRRAWDASPMGVALVDGAGRMVEVNPALRGLARCNGDELRGAAVGTLADGPDRRRLDAVLARLLDGATSSESFELRLTGRGPPDEAIPVAVIASPVRAGGGALLQFEDLRERRRAEQTRASLLAEQAARAQAEAAAARERRIAAALQADLLPDTLPEVPGVAMAAALRSGGDGDGVQVGGDWYDALALPGGRLGIVVGDVAGRGVEAAARMGELRAVARAYALEGHPPAELLARLNQYQLSLEADAMTTLLYAVIEPDRGHVRYASAGHVPPLLAAAGELRFLDGGGPALGAVDTTRYVEASEPFPAGALLTLYTDGLVERRGEVLDVGLRRLRDAIAAGGASPDGARAAALRACLADGSADDDVTIVCVQAAERLGTPARFVLTSDPQALTALRRALRRWLAEVHAGERDSAEITLAANEAWQNAIEHGNAFAMTPIAVELDLDGDAVVCEVRDRGHPGEHPADPDRGRGIPLMRELMDDVELDVGGPRGGLVRLRRTLHGV